jgi:hypothetical protein
LPEPERIVPSQHLEQHDNQSILHSVHSHESRSGDVKPRIHIDTTRPSTSPTDTGTSMLMRHSPMRHHVRLTSHPYRRPKSAAGSATVRQQHVRFAERASGSSVPMVSSVSAPARMTSSASSLAAVRCALYPECFIAVMRDERSIVIVRLPPAAARVHHWQSHHPSNLKSDASSFVQTCTTTRRVRSLLLCSNCPA